MGTVYTHGPTESGDTMDEAEVISVNVVSGTYSKRMARVTYKDKRGTFTATEHQCLVNGTWTNKHGRKF